MKALLVVDVEKCFVPNPVSGSLPGYGELPVPDGAAVVPVAERLARSDEYDVVVASRDLHPDDHFSFSDDPSYSDGSWPPHGRRGTPGSQFAWTLPEGTVVIDKGTVRDVEAYSAFDGYSKGMTLADVLKRHNVTHVDVIGLAHEVCVTETALSSTLHGFVTRVLTEGTRALTPEGFEGANRMLVASGVEVV